MTSAEGDCDQTWVRRGYPGGAVRSRRGVRRGRGGRDAGSRLMGRLVVGPGSRT